jgi:hypothetical protein
LKIAYHLVFEKRRGALVAGGSNHRRIIPRTGTRSRPPHNWRIIFRFEGDDALDVGLVDYH